MDTDVPIQSPIIFYDFGNLPSTSGTSHFHTESDLHQTNYYSSDDDDSLRDPDFFPSSEDENESSDLDYELHTAENSQRPDFKDNLSTKNMSSKLEIQTLDSLLDQDLHQEPLEQVLQSSELDYELHNAEDSQKPGFKDHLSTKNMSSKSEIQTLDTLVDQDLHQQPLEQVLQVEVEQVKARNYKDKRVYCFFCDKDVLDFSRHLKTWHSYELDVQRMLSFPAKSKQRRDAIRIIKNQGNFVKNRASEQIRPIKRASNNEVKSSKNYLPCKYCLGFYSKRFLYRHTKKCTKNPEGGQSVKRQTSQSDGHSTLLLRSLLKHDVLLEKELFPKMRADDINMVAKKDFLICTYAYSYMKGRRSKGNVDLVRQNVRRLAKLLQITREKNQIIKELIDMLRPCHFRIIIEGVNEIAGYNSDTETYTSPTLAMNFGTLLKKCCDLAYIHFVQMRDTDDKQKEVQVLKTLIESQWSNEVSAQAGSNLNAQKWNKSDLVPLTSDLRKLKNYLERITHELYMKLQENRSDRLAYNSLKEALYSQIILINRRRPAEIAQLKVTTYQSVNLNVTGVSEFENCLTETEKILVNTFSRIVIRGKRGRGVPVLLSPLMKKYFDFLIEIRENFVTGNPYVFHTSGANCVDGTKVLRKYVQKSGIKNVESITATKLRKHLATVTQLLNFSDKDLEQLSKFMGHTLNTHCQFYRLPDNVYQTAKVSKLLLLMSQGGADEYRGKTIDEIDINLEPIEAENQPFEDALGNIAQEEEANENQSVENDIRTEKALQKPKRNRITWTKHEKRIIANHFANNITEKRAPKKKKMLIA